MNRNDMLCQLMALNFSLVDLNLYLDTHPEDYKAIETFNDIKKEFTLLKDEYEETFGPLTPGTTKTNQWTWICDPWPWEKMFNQEV